MIVRKVKKTNYTSISNSSLQDKRLSFKAKGLLTLFLSLPNDWDFNKKGIIAFTTDGKASIESAIKELKKYHYLKIVKVMPNKENPKLDYLWTIYEEPFQDTDFQDTDFQDTDFQDTENRQLQNNNIQNNKKQNNNIQNKVSKKEAEAMSYNKIIKTYFADTEMQNVMTEFIKMRKMTKRPITNYGLKLICDKLIKDYKQEEWQAVVQQSIVNNWQNIYPLKKNSQELKDKAREAYIKDVEYKTKQKETAQQRDDRNLKKMLEVGEKMLKEWNDDNTGNSKISETNQNALTDTSDTRT